MTKELSQVEKDFCEFMESNYKAKFVDCAVVKKPIRHPEDQLHKQIAKYLFILEKQKRIDSYTYNPSGELRTKTTGALLKAKGLKKGLPDYTIKKTKNIPTNNGEVLTISFYLYLEAKCGKNKQTTEQIEFQARTEMTINEIYRVVRSIEEVVKATDEFLRIIS
ncbi:MAG: hypothetical protein LBG48_03230 [Rickettsiales bacterium]|jgi:hypothetical protein|nr:hypothetical protein [Rickettsiales bacterium]